MLAIKPANPAQDGENKMKSKLSIKSKVVAGVSALVILGSLVFTNFAVKSARVAGCTEMAKLILPPETSPYCSLRGDSLTVNVSHPLLGGMELSYDVSTGKILQDE